MRKIRLIHLIHSLGFGGAEKVVFDLSRSACPKYFDVSILMLGEEKGMISLFEKENILVECLNPRQINFRPIRVPYRFWEGVDKIVKMHEQQPIDVIHAHMSYSAFLATLVKLRLPKVKIVFTSHSYNMESKVDEWILFFTKKWRNADVIFSQDMQDKIYRKDATIIPNGIRMKEYELKLPKFKRFSFLCIGRLIYYKNQKSIITATKQLVDKGYDFDVLLIGDGPDKAMLEMEVEKHKLQNHIKLLGLRKDIPQLCNSGHCLLLPSLWEGLPIVLLEAAASSLPIICTDVGCISDLMDQDNLGYLIPDSSTLVEKMEEVLNNYEEATQKGIRFNQKVKKQYDIQSITQQHEQLYTELVRAS